MASNQPHRAVHALHANSTSFPWTCCIHMKYLRRIRPQNVCHDKKKKSIAPHFSTPVDTIPRRKWWNLFQWVSVPSAGSSVELHICVSCQHSCTLHTPHSHATPNEKKKSHSKSKSHQRHCHLSRFHLRAKQWLVQPNLYFNSPLLPTMSSHSCHSSPTASLHTFKGYHFACFISNANP